MRPSLFARLIDGDGTGEHEVLAYIGGGLIGVAVANVVLVLAFGVNYVS
jgi:hypothetical protein